MPSVRSSFSSKSESDSKTQSVLPSRGLRRFTWPEALPAFAAVWRALGRPAFRILAQLSEWPGMHAAMKLGYSLFVKVRPWLPRKSCEEGKLRTHKTEVNMKTWIVATLGVLSASAAYALASSSHHEPLATVPRVDLSRYTGVWYEIARLPQRYEKNCTGVTARYEVRPDGRLSVENRCFKSSLSGPEKVARGVARVVDPPASAKLEVSFFWPFWGDYWILELGGNYEYSVVGTPDRSSLWILSRTPQMDPTLVREILDRRSKQGFDTSRMEWTVQPELPTLSLQAG